MATEAEILLTRKNQTYIDREEQLRVNILALNGGRPYIDNRLTRFPAESDVEWNGSAVLHKESTFSNVQPGVKGRRERAYLINNAFRIAEKIRQFVFATAPDREGLPEEYADDINRQGMSIDALMGRVCHLSTACRWAWIGVDMPRIKGEDGQPRRISRAEAQAMKVRPYWQWYGANEVVDWKFNELGELEWLITERFELFSANPAQEPVQHVIRHVWMPGMLRVVVGEVPKGTVPSIYNPPKLVKDEEVPIDIDIVPFTPVGDISGLPYWYDDIEGIQRAIMDLESANDAMYFKQIYPQLVLPASVSNEMTGQSGPDDLARNVNAIVGGAYAILEDQDHKGITRFVMPDGSALDSIQKELERKRTHMYGVVGMALTKQTRMAESAESKAYDHLDTEAVLRDKANMLSEAERKAIEISRAWSADFPEYVPEYAQSFDIGDIHDDIRSLVDLSNMDTTDGIKRVVLEAAFKKAQKIGDVSMSDDEVDAILEEIKNFSTTTRFEFNPDDLDD